MKKISIFLLCVLKILFAYGQEKYKHSTPQAAGIIAQGEIPVSLYTGKLNLSIPIYQINDPDFKIPISISYNSSGFQPLKHSGPVGHDWTLLAGGCITREVYNLPDEYIKTTNIENTYCNGFLVQSRLVTFNKDDVYNFSSSVGTIDSNKNFKFHNPELDEDFDYMPDMFNFNFNGHSGSFVIGNNGKIKIMSDEIVDVDLTNMQGFAPQIRNYMTLSDTELSEIKITDMDGYIYYFGGDISSVEYTLNVNGGTNGEAVDNSLYQQLTPTINSWYLKKIVAPNGREVQFNYKKSQYDSDNYLKTDPIWQFTEKRNFSGEGGNVVKTATKSVVLSEILIPDINLVIDFNSDIESKNLFVDAGGDFCNKNYQINHIEGSIEGNTLFKYDFLYTYFGGNLDWGYRYLTQIISNNGQKYSFSYIHPDGYVNPVQILRENLDDYGFWKTNSLQGLIESVTYPTGGKTEFKFEQNDYSIKRYSELTNKIEQKLVATLPTVTGGVRIRSIKNYIGSSLKNTKLYNYTDLFYNETKLDTYNESGTGRNLDPQGYECIVSEYENQTDMYSVGCDPIVRSTTPGSGISINSTGILTSNLMKVQFNGAYNWIKTERSDIYNLMPSHIGYSQVTEINIDNLSGERVYVNYDFSDYIYNGDVKYTNTTISNISLKLVYRYQYAYSSMSYKRGKIIKETGYDKNKQVVYIKKFIYSNINYNGNDSLITDIPSQVDLTTGSNISSENYIVTLQNYGDCAIARRIYFAPILVCMTNFFEKRDSLTIENTTSYKYDSKNRKIEEQSINSSFKTQFKKFRYPDNIVSNVSSSANDLINGYIQLVNKNIVSMPVEIISGLIDAQDTWYTGGELILYKPTAISTLSAPYQKYVFSTNKPVKDYSATTLSADSIIKDSRYELSANFEFSSLLRIIKFNETGKAPILYEWDSKNMYPYKETIGNLITTYTYKPLVGMTSMTDPRGVTTYYDYDNFNRLKETYMIENGVKKILQRHEYHYTNQ